MKRLFIVTLLLLSFLCFGQNEDILRFKYKDKMQYKENKIIVETVFLNGEFSHTSNIHEKIATTVMTKTEKGAELMSQVSVSVFKAIFGNSKGYILDKDYFYLYNRDNLGKIDMKNSTDFPVLRNIPNFSNSEKSLVAGDKWYSKGYEVHSLKDDFGIDEPIEIPVAVEYEYLGYKEYKGVEYPAIKIRYSIYNKPNFKNLNYKTFPIEVNGYSDRILYWDNSVGIPIYSSENFELIFEMSDGQVLRYVGESFVNAMETRELTDEEFVSLKKALESGDIIVKRTEQGINIVLEDVKFAAESSTLLPSERPRLKKIAEELKKYRDRDLRIEGHTALAGTENGRYELSKKRATVVRDFLISEGSINDAQMVTIVPMGAKSPVADNKTAEGMAKNRRVEIVIMDN